MALHKEIGGNYNDIQKPKIELTREQTEELLKSFQKEKEGITIIGKKLGLRN